MTQLQFIGYCAIVFLVCAPEIHAQLTRKEKEVYAQAKPGSWNMKQKELQGITFNCIPAGSFAMGSPRKEFDEFDGDIMGRAADEELHLVELSEYWMSTHEITQDKFTEVMGYNPSKCEPLEDDDWRIGFFFWKEIKRQASKHWQLDQAHHGSRQLSTKCLETI